MRIAILITGQPRFIDQSAWWYQNKVFPAGCGIDIDVYCHFWDDGTGTLKERAMELYNTDKVVVEDFDSVIENFSNIVRHKNTTEFTDWTGVPTSIQENILFNTPEITQYGKNYHGQYLSAGLATEIFKDDLMDYYMVIKTRSDCILNNMPIKQWKDSFTNIYRNLMFRDTLFAPWLYIKAGKPFHGDFAFIGRPEIWLQYGLGIIPSLTKICTENKRWFEETTPPYGDDSVHWMWNKINVHTRNNWLSFSTVWPTSFGATLVREHDAVYNINDFKQIEQRYWTLKQANS